MEKVQEKSPKKPEEADIMHTSDAEMPDVSSEEKRIEASKKTEEEIKEAFEGQPKTEPKKGAA